MFKIKGIPRGYVDIKRFYMDGVELIYKCPKCGHLHEHEFCDYLSYPSMNEKVEFNLYCNKCGYEWVEYIKLNISIEVVNEEDLNMSTIDMEIKKHEKAIQELKAEKAKQHKEIVQNIREYVQTLESSEFLDLVQEQVELRKRDRNEIRGGNDIEINKIHLLLTDKFWCTKIYILLEGGQYKGITDKKVEAEKYVDDTKERSYKEEIVDLRDIY